MGDDSAIWREGRYAKSGLGRCTAVVGIGSARHQCRRPARPGSDRCFEHVPPPPHAGLLQEVGEELMRSICRHDRFHSAHEGYAVILEELDELKAEVWLKREYRSPERMRKEALQVAATALRFIHDLLPPAPTEPDR